MQLAKNYIIENGGEVKELSVGQRFSEWNGQDVRYKNYKCIVRFKGVGLIGHTFEAIAKKLNERHIIDLHSLGYNTCSRCGGSGQMPYAHVDGGTCFKCRGTGFNLND